MGRVSAFLEFAKREVDGTIRDDASYRAYDLDRHTGERTLQNALRYVGYPGICGLIELRSDLRGMGYTGDIAGPLLRWYIWHRLCTGDLRKWPLRNETLTKLAIDKEQNEKPL